MFSLRYLSFSSIFIFVVIGCATSAIDDQTVALPTAADTGETPILARPSSTTPPTVSPTPSSTASPTFAPTSLLPNVTPSPTITPTLPITSSFRAIPYTETEWAKIIELQNIHWGLLSPDHTLIASAFIELDFVHLVDKKGRQDKLISPTKEKSYAYLAPRDYDSIDAIYANL